MAKNMASYRLEDLSTYKLSVIAGVDKRSQADELEWLIDIRFNDLGLEVPKDWAPPVRPPKEDKPVKASKGAAKRK